MRPLPSFASRRVGDGIERAVEIQAVEFAGIDQPAFFGERAGRGQVTELAVRGRDHLLDRQTVFLREFLVALVVRRHRHHRAGAVIHQHDSWRPTPALRAPVSGCSAFRPVSSPSSPSSPCRLRRPIAASHSAMKSASSGSVFGQLPAPADARAARLTIGHAHQRVGARGVNSKPVMPASGAARSKRIVTPRDLADPVALHGLDLLGPVRQLVEVVAAAPRRSR